MPRVKNKNITDYELMCRIARLYACLAQLRKIAGISVAKMAAMLNMSRQGYSALEKKSDKDFSLFPMAQYIAIRCILDAWVEGKDRPQFERLMYLLLDDFDVMGKAYLDLLDVTKTVAESIHKPEHDLLEQILKTSLDKWEAFSRPHIEELKSMKLIQEKDPPVIFKKYDRWIDMVLERSKNDQ